jgi:mRNA interferase RelE/StbE
MDTIDYTRRAQRDLRRLDRPVAERILEALERLARDGAGDVRPLTGQLGRYRLRVGEWRVGFTRDREAESLVVLWVMPRGRAYRD